MVAKIFALNIKNYLSDSFNVFDALVVLTSLIEKVLE